MTRRWYPQVHEPLNGRFELAPSRWHVWCLRPELEVKRSFKGYRTKKPGFSGWRVTSKRLSGPWRPVPVSGKNRQAFAASAEKREVTILHFVGILWVEFPQCTGRCLLVTATSAHYFLSAAVSAFARFFRQNKITICCMKDSLKELLKFFWGGYKFGAR